MATTVTTSTLASFAMNMDDIVMDAGPEPAADHVRGNRR
jgi:hypothetical protein